MVATEHNWDVLCTFWATILKGYPKLSQMHNMPIRQWWSWMWAPKVYIYAASFPAQNSQWINSIPFPDKLGTSSKIGNCDKATFPGNRETKSWNVCIALREIDNISVGVPDIHISLLGLVSGNFVHSSQGDLPRVHCEAGRTGPVSRSQTRCGKWSRDVYCCCTVSIPPRILDPFHCSLNGKETPKQQSHNNHCFVRSIGLFQRLRYFLVKNLIVGV